MKAELAALKLLPIFEVAVPPLGSAGHRTSDVAAFVNLRDSALHLVPPDAPHEGTLTSRCLLPASEMEHKVLHKYFQISSWTLAVFYRQDSQSI